MQRLEFPVDTPHCEGAAAELYEILLRQQRAFLDRWYQGSLTQRVVPLLSKLGLLLSLLGLALCLYIWFVAPTWCPAWLQVQWFVPLFVAFAVIFLLLMKPPAAFYRWNLHILQRRCRRHADKLVAQAKAAAPFLARYELMGDTLRYWRGKDDAWRLVWERKLSRYRKRGIAILGANVTAIFRRSRSFYPVIVVLQKDAESARALLQGAGIAIKTA